MGNGIDEILSDQIIYFKDRESDKCRLKWCDKYNEESNKAKRNKRGWNI